MKMSPVKVRKLSDLPLDLLTLITELLPTSDLNALGQTSRCFAFANKELYRKCASSGDLEKSVMSNNKEAVQKLLKELLVHDWELNTMLNDVLNLVLLDSSFLGGKTGESENKRPDVIRILLSEVGELEANASMRVLLRLLQSTATILPKVKSRAWVHLTIQNPAIQEESPAQALRHHNDIIVIYQEHILAQIREHRDRLLVPCPGYQRKALARDEKFQEIVLAAFPTYQKIVAAFPEYQNIIMPDPKAQKGFPARSPESRKEIFARFQAAKSAQYRDAQEASISSCGTHYVTITPGWRGVFLYECQSGRKCFEMAGEQRVRWSSDGRQLLMYEHGKLRVYDTTTAELSSAEIFIQSEIFKKEDCIVVLKDNDIVYLERQGNTWNQIKRQQLQNLNHTIETMTSCISPRHFLSQDHNTIYVWSIDGEADAAPIALTYTIDNSASHFQPSDDYAFVCAVVPGGIQILGLDTAFQLDISLEHDSCKLIGMTCQHDGSYIMAVEYRFDVRPIQDCTFIAVYSIRPMERSEKLIWNFRGHAGFLDRSHLGFVDGNHIEVWFISEPEIQPVEKIFFSPDRPSKIRFHAYPVPNATNRPRRN